ncbi:hypothetical protein BCR33DRAFT_717942 [Rhizoclosmatium globosum]|uniref:Uncharacterized protein n=1 Tax=Rhizoclosmatium globosum TaxID=329046 RepID=A0A1Y2C6U4_9FUNG|nr:hypothetical protein BCR33DRAFT_717942 [Rhizoclosmatium globosum]|eukprot:ORY42749.1 hypothetical protein BCR33DRAFT_717942 [Rhizoclosmatium globosum]
MANSSSTQATAAPPDDYETRQTKQAAYRILTNPSLLHMHALANDQTLAQTTLYMKCIAAGFDPNQSDDDKDNDNSEVSGTSKADAVRVMRRRDRRRRTWRSRDMYEVPAVVSFEGGARDSSDTNAERVDGSSQLERLEEQAQQQHVLDETGGRERGLNNEERTGENA